eukprot:3669226-Rhodomonas_salina.3
MRRELAGRNLPTKGTFMLEERYTFVDLLRGLDGLCCAAPREKRKEKIEEKEGKREKRVNVSLASIEVIARRENRGHRVQKGRRQVRRAQDRPRAARDRILRPTSRDRERERLTLQRQRQRLTLQAETETENETDPKAERGREGGREGERETGCKRTWPQLEEEAGLRVSIWPEEERLMAGACAGPSKELTCESGWWLVGDCDRDPPPPLRASAIITPPLPFRLSISPFTPPAMCSCAGTIHSRCCLSSMSGPGSNALCGFPSSSSEGGGPSAVRLRVIMGAGDLGRGWRTSRSSRRQHAPLPRPMLSSSSVINAACAEKERERGCKSHGIIGNAPLQRKRAW